MLPWCSSCYKLTQSSQFSTCYSIELFACLLFILFFLVTRCRKWNFKINLHNFPWKNIIPCIDEGSWIQGGIRDFFPTVWLIDIRLNTWGQQSKVIRWDAIEKCLSEFIPPAFYWILMNILFAIWFAEDVKKLKKRDSSSVDLSFQSIGKIIIHCSKDALEENFTESDIKCRERDFEEICGWRYKRKKH